MPRRSPASPDSPTRSFTSRRRRAAVRTDPRTRRLLAALARSPRLRRLVYASTTGVYGDRGGALTDETAPLAPASDRARRRVDAEAGCATSAAPRTSP